MVCYLNAESTGMYYVDLRPSGLASNITREMCDRHTTGALVLTLSVIKSRGENAYKLKIHIYL